MINPHHCRHHHHHHFSSFITSLILGARRCSKRGLLLPSEHLICLSFPIDVHHLFCQVNKEDGGAFPWSTV